MENNFSFGSINTANKKNILKVKLEKNIILSDFQENTSQPRVVILTDQYFNADQLTSINFFLKANGLRNYMILMAVNSREISPYYVKEILKLPIIKFYTNNKSDYQQHIEKDDIIIATGASIYSVTGTDNIYTGDLYDVIFSPTKIAVDNHWVYVVDSFTDIFAQGFRTGAVDSFKTKIFQFRIKDLLLNGKVPPPTKARMKRVKISDEEFETWAEEMLSKNYTHMSTDTETSGFHFKKDRMGDITISFDGKTGYHVFASKDKVPTLNKLLQNHIIIGTNFKFDAKFFWALGCTQDFEYEEDIFILAHTLNETRRNGMKTLSYLYTTNGGHDKLLDAFKAKKKVESYIDDIPDDIRIPYAIDDAIITFKIWEGLTEHIKKLDIKFPNERYPQHTLEKYYRNIRIPVDNMYARLEYRGVYVDKSENEKGRLHIESEMLEMRKQLYELLELPLPRGFDGEYDDNVEHLFEKPNQLGKHLEEIGWEDLGRAKNKTYLTGDFQLERWAKTHKAAKVMQRYRSAKTILSTFVGNREETKGWTKYFTYHEDGTVRMHPSFTTMGADTGRSKCKNPNMQNPPAHGEFAGDATHMMSTKDNEKYYMVTVDYSALQLRLATIDSMDPILTEVFKSDNADMHSLTGYNVIKNSLFNVEIIEVEEDGTHYSFLGGQLIKIIRDGEEKEIFASDLEENDKLKR